MRLRGTAKKETMAARALADMAEWCRENAGGPIEGQTGSGTETSAAR
jgi:hypothetical protein